MKGNSEINTTHKKCHRCQHHIESINCMSKVLEDLSKLLGTESGDPDQLFDAIEELQEREPKKRRRK